MTTGCIHRFSRSTAKCTSCGLSAIPFVLEEYSKLDGALRSVLSNLVLGDSKAAERVTRGALAGVAEMMQDEDDAKQMALFDGRSS